VENGNAMQAFFLFFFFLKIIYIYIYIYIYIFNSTDKNRLATFFFLKKKGSKQLGRKRVTL